MLPYLRHYAGHTGTFIPLSDYCAQNCMVLKTDVPGSHPIAYIHLISECCRVLIVHLIRVNVDCLQSGFCLSPLSLSKSNIAIDLDHGNVPILCKIDQIPNTGTCIDQSFAGLGRLIRDDIIGNHPVPADLEDLLALMATDAHLHIELIWVHSSLVPLLNLREVLFKLHDEFCELKQTSHSVYKNVSQYIVFPGNWETLLQPNYYLVQINNSRTRAAAGQGGSGGAAMQPVVNVAPHRSLVRVQQVQGQKAGTSAAAQTQQAQGQGGGGRRIGGGSSSGSSSRMQQPPAAKWMQQPVASLAPPHLATSQVCVGKAQAQAQAQVQVQGQTQKQGQGRHGNVHQQLWKVKNAASSSSAPPAPALPLPQQLHRLPLPTITIAAAAPPPPAAPAPPLPQQPQPPWPLLIVGKYNGPGTDPVDEVVHYNRNGRAHRPQVPQEDLEVVYLSVFPKLIPSFQKGLHHVGRLSHLKLETLIPTP